MKFHGIQINEGSTVTNLTISAGTTFPSLPSEGELFFRNDNDTRLAGLYLYLDGSWDRIASTESVTIPTAPTLPANANMGDIAYKNSGDSSAGMYVFNGSTWVTVAAAAGSGLTVSGDVSGSLTVGADGTLTLATVNVAPGSIGSATTSTLLTVNGKGLVTAASTVPIGIDATQVTTGSFPNGRISASNVTQHQGSLAIGASQVTSGTFADARIAQSNVTQHQAALTIAESQITDGALLARNAGNETITGSWSFNNPVTVGAPVSGSQAATKTYVDSAIAGLSWKQAVKCATIANINLTGTQTVDSVGANVGDRVLVKNQNTQSQNGIYVVAAGAWTRATDFDQISPIDEVNSAAVFVQQGAVNANTAWTQYLTVATVGTDSMAFTQFAGANTFIAGNGLTLSSNTFNVGTASTSRIVVNADDIDLALVADAGTGSFVKITRDAYGRVSGTTAVTSADITPLVNASYVLKAGDTMTGALAIQSTLAVTGAAQAASLNITGGSNPGNGLWLSGTNTLSFATGSAERMRLDSSGRLAVGTTAATDTLTVNGSAAFQTNSTTDVFKLYTLSSGLTYVGTTTATNIGVITGGGEKMRIDTAGNVGIGTTAPVRTLHIAGAGNGDGGHISQLTVRSTSAYNTSPTAGIHFGGLYNAAGSTFGMGGIHMFKETVTDGDTASTMAFFTRTGPAVGTVTERMRIDSNGNVMIGTTSQSGKFIVSSNTSAIADYSPSQFTAVFAGADSQRTRLFVDSFNEMPGITLRRTNGTNAAKTKVLAGDTVGFINHHSYNAGVAGYMASATMNFFATEDWTTSSNFGTAIGFNTFANGTGAGGERLRINHNGNILIGTTTDYRSGQLVVKSTNKTLASTTANVNISTTDAQAANYGASISLGGMNDTAATSEAPFAYLAGRKENGTSGDLAGYLQFGVTQSNAATIEAMRITSLGYVGIGTSTPGGPLHVYNSAGTNTPTVTIDSSEARGGYISVKTVGTTIGDIGSALRIYGTGTASDFGLNARGTGGLTFGTANTERMRIASSGDVGIGTSAPTRKLDIQGSVRVMQDLAATSGAVTIRQNVGNTVGGFIQWVTNDSTSEKGWLTVDTSSNMLFATVSTERMRITAAGVIQDAAGNELGYKDIPVSSGAFARGKCNDISASTTVPQAAAGTTYYVYNNSASSITLSQASGLTMWLGGTSSSGSRTLLPHGMATIWYRSATECVINGNVT